MDRLVVISGCSSSGKSTLLSELSHRGYAVIEEPGRRIVQEELASAGSALDCRLSAALIRTLVSRTTLIQASAQLHAGPA